jgi:hypothetical protein
MVFNLYTVLFAFAVGLIAGGSLGVTSLFSISRQRWADDFIDLRSVKWLEITIGSDRRQVWSGRIVARTGLRMMPTFPRSPLTFRKASFPRYG